MSMSDRSTDDYLEKKACYVNSEPIERLRSVLSDVRERAETLRDGLSPVLRSYDPQPSPDGPARVAELLSPACQEIEEVGEAALTTYLILQDILERLQLPSFGPAEKYNEADVKAPPTQGFGDHARALGLPDLWRSLSPPEQEKVTEFARTLLPGLGEALNPGYGAVADHPGAADPSRKEDVRDRV